MDQTVGSMAPSVKGDGVGAIREEREDKGEELTVRYGVATRERMHVRLSTSPAPTQSPGRVGTFFKNSAIFEGEPWLACGLL